MKKRHWLYAAVAAGAYVAFAAFKAWRNPQLPTGITNGVITLSTVSFSQALIYYLEHPVAGI